MLVMSTYYSSFSTMYSMLLIVPQCSLILQYQYNTYNTNTIHTKPIQYIQYQYNTYKTNTIHTIPIHTKPIQYIQNKYNIFNLPCCFPCKKWTFHCKDQTFLSMDSCTLIALWESCVSAKLYFWYTSHNAALILNE